MDLLRLSLSNFRNFARVDSIELPEASLLVAAAPNAVGKTNFLESMVILLRGRSWRASSEQCIRWNAEAFRLEGEVKTIEGKQQLSVSYHRPTRKLRIEENNQLASLVTFYSRYPLLIFLPEDSFLFTRGPEQRRNFLNHVLVSSNSYVAALVQYQRALRQRNAALKNAQSFEEIAPWTDLLVTHADAIWKQRQAFITFLETHLNPLYKELSGESRTFKIRLSETHEPEKMTELLMQAFSSEQRFGHTSLGPHRDDFEIETEGHPVKAVLSRGQMRSLTLALKVAAHRFLKQSTTEEPLLLLDDVFSELDEKRQRALIEHLPTSQILVTCTTVPQVIRERSDAHILDLRKILATPTTLLPASMVERTQQRVAA